MDLFANPSALIGLIGCIGLAGWGMGRWQGLSAHAQAAEDLPETHRSPETRAITSDPPAPIDLHAPHTNRGLRDTAVTLSDLHAEITRFRHHEQVLATLETEAVMFDRRSSGQLALCRDVGAVGTPRCHDMVVDDVPCHCLQGCGNQVVAEPATASPEPVPMAQPSPGASPFTRV
jgi:hypothetical protein